MVRYQDKAVVLGVVITAVLVASAGQLHYTRGGNCTDRREMLTLEQLTQTMEKHDQASIQ